MKFIVLVLALVLAVALASPVPEAEAEPQYYLDQAFEDSYGYEGLDDVAGLDAAPWRRRPWGRPWHRRPYYG
jgi:hypothetical protein